MADVSRTVDIIFRGQNQLGQALVPIKEDMGDLGEVAEWNTDAFNNLGDEIDDLGGAPAASINKLNVALKALAVGLITDRFIDVNIAAEKFNKTMEYATGSTAEAAQEWAYAVEVSERFGLELTGTAAAYAKFIAGTQGSVLSTEQLKSTFEGVSGTLSLVGSSALDVEEALRQMTQGIGKNRFELADLKSIAERVPGGMYAIADALGITTEELYKNITAGEFGAEQIAIYAETLNQGLDGVSFDTFENALNRLKNTVSNAFIDLGDAGVFTAFSKSIEGINTVIIGSLGAFELLGTRIGLVLAALADGDWTLSGDNFKDSWGDAVNEVATNISNARDRFLDFGDGAAAGSAKAVGATDNLNQSLDDTVGIIVELDALPGGAFTEVADSADKAALAAQKAGIELEKIASNERIKLIESKIELDIASLEADAKKAVAVIESLSTTIDSTGQLLGDLFGTFEEADSFYEKFKIEDQIDLENDRRQEALDIQSSLAKSTIAFNKAKIDALKNNNALITVQGDGLQPHLEAFMWEILESIQVRVNADGLEMLLGAP